MEASAPDTENRRIPDELARDMDRDNLSRLVREVNDAGISYQEMADRADADGYPVSKPYLQKLAVGAVSTAPTPDRLRGIAAALRTPLTIVQRAAAVQYLDYQATELSGYEEEVRVIVAHLAGMEKAERRKWLAMMEASEKAERDND